MKRHAETFFELSIDFMAVASFDGVFQFLTPNWTQLGWTLEELQSRPFVDFVHPYDVERTKRETQGLVEGTKTIHFANRYRCKDGSIRWLSWCAVGSPEKKLIYAVARDVTAQKKAELERTEMTQKLIQASKLASLGTLSAGVAHELNNPLAAVRGYAEMIERSQSVDAKERRFASEIVKASYRMQKIIDHLRTFGRETKAEDRCAIQLSQIVQNCLVLLEKQLLLEAIRVVVIKDKVEPFIWGDAVQLESIFQNLLINSRDSFEEVTDGRAKTITFTIRRSGRKKVVVTCEDNALGIPPNSMDRLFDPFFTTKQVGKGTGLGLSITHGVVQAHNGTIQAASVVDRGSKFTMEFPIHEKADSTVKRATRKKPANLSLESKSGLKPKVLIVEDDTQVAHTLNALLHDSFDIELISDAPAALNQLRERAYQLILSDLHMPKISGVNVLKAARESQPETPVLVMSGRDPGDKDVDLAIAQGARGFIKKPFPSAEELARILHATIGKN